MSRGVQLNIVNSVCMDDGDSSVSGAWLLSCGVDTGERRS